MFSLAIGQKWWAGMVAGVFGVLGVGTALVAVPAFADSSGRSFNAASATGVSVRLECKQGAWSAGSFQWTSGVTAVGSPVALPNCPGDGGRRVVTLPDITMPGTGTAPGTGVATADGFLIRVSGMSRSGGATAACTLPSPALGSKAKSRRQVTMTCAADGATREHQAHMKVKVKWLGVNNDDDGPGKSKDNNGKNDENGDKNNKRGWMSGFSRERDS